MKRCRLDSSAIGKVHTRHWPPTDESTCAQERSSESGQRARCRACRLRQESAKSPTTPPPRAMTARARSDSPNNKPCAQASAFQCAKALVCGFAVAPIEEFHAQPGPASRVFQCAAPELPASCGTVTTKHRGSSQQTRQHSAGSCNSPRSSRDRCVSQVRSYWNLLHLLIIRGSHTGSDLAETTTQNERVSRDGTGCEHWFARGVCTLPTKRQHSNRGTRGDIFGLAYLIREVRSPPRLVGFFSSGFSAMALRESMCASAKKKTSPQPGRLQPPNPASGHQPELLSQTSAS